MRKIGHISADKLQLMVGRTAIMHRKGKTPEEIAERLKVSIEEVNEMLELVKIVDEAKSKEQER